MSLSQRTDYFAASLNGSSPPQIGCRTPKSFRGMSENPGARLCRPRPAAASPKIAVSWSVSAVLRLVFDTAALHFQAGAQI